MFLWYFTRLPVFSLRAIITLESKNKLVYFVLCSLTRNFAVKIYKRYKDIVGFLFQRDYE